jgi:hypothetical protein
MNPLKTDIKYFGGYAIATAFDSSRDGIYGFAYCPICGWKEESHDHNQGEEHAIRLSIMKVKTHMTIIHNIKDQIIA